MSKLTDYSDRLFIALQDELAQTEQLSEPILARTQKAINACNKSIQALCVFTATYRFTGAEEEIEFFKKIKPLFVAELVYYAKIYQLHIRWPVGDAALHREYLRRAIFQLHQFFEDNEELYRYYRTNSSARDHEYFLRNNGAHGSLMPVAFFINGDSFSTGYDLQLAAILAFDRLVEYLADLMAAPDNPPPPANSRLPAKVLQWTDDKIGLVELPYSIAEKGCCNNGNASIREIIAALESTFHTKLTNHPRLWIIVRRRKTDKPSFLQRLLDCLKKRIDNADD